MKRDIQEYSPPYAKATGVMWLLNEAIDHLCPWTAQYWRHHKAIEAAGIALAIAVASAWGLAVNGQIGASAVIGWWIGWSIYEIFIRLQCKPYIKDGPWWGRLYRTAGRMDMICYVMFKNLLIGASLFIVLRNLGFLQMVD
jgi:hypothetical protein